MAADEMAAELVSGRERTLEIDPGAGAPLAQGRARECLLRSLDREPAGALLDHGETRAGARDRGAERDLAGIVARVDLEPPVAPRTLGHHGADVADVGDDSGEHAMV